MIEEKKARLDKAEVSAPKKSSQPQSKTNNNTNSSETYYSRFKDYHGDEESESEGVFDMIKNVFTGIFAALDRRSIHSFHALRFSMVAGERSATSPIFTAGKRS